MACHVHVMHGTDVDGRATCHWLENHPNNHYRNAAHLSQSKEKSPTFLKRPFSTKKTRKKTDLSHLHPLFLAKNWTLFFFWLYQPPYHPTQPTQPTQPNCTQKTHLQGWCTTWLTWKLKSSTRPSRLIRAFGLKLWSVRDLPETKRNLEKMGTEVAPQASQRPGKIGFFAGMI